MSDQNTELQTETPADESSLEALKARADALGITYAKNISAVNLAAKITAALAPALEAEAAAESATDTAVQAAMKLLRVIVTPLDGNKASQHDSAEFTAGNSVVPYVSRVIPFGREWHVESILVDNIKGKTYQQFTSRKNSRGIDVVTAKRLPAYQVVILDPLTEDELKALAAQQARTGALDED